MSLKVQSVGAVVVLVAADAAAVLANMARNAAATTKSAVLNL
jgi:hypothetical protein